MQSLGVELEEKTRNYWSICRQWNGKRKRGERKILTGEAIAICNDVIFATNVDRPIVRRMKELQRGLIVGTSQILDSPAKILKLSQK